MQIYIFRDHVQSGPFSEAEIRAQLTAGSLQLSDLAWSEGVAEWTALGSLPGFGSVPVVAPVPAATATVTLPVMEVEKLQWYEYAWIGWPLVLLFLGGAIGGACGGMAAGLNHQLFRKIQQPVLRYVVTGSISVGAILVYVVVAGAVVALFRK